MSDVKEAKELQKAQATKEVVEAEKAQKARESKGILQKLRNREKFIFADAISFLEGKAVISFEEYKNLSEEYRALAFSVAKYTQIEVLNEFRSAVIGAIKNGTTMSKFQDDMNEFLETKGYVGLISYKANNIFRTNIQTAYNVGHYNSMNEVKKLRPYWQYRTTGDGKVRTAHQAMDGKVFFADDPIWNVWYPPNGHGCRCIVISLTENQVKRKGLEVENEVPTKLDLETAELNSILPDKGFRTNPAINKFNPDMKEYPESIRNAYEQAMQK